MKACWKRYDGANVPKWNLEVEPFVIQWVVQMEEDTHGLGVVKDHMSPWGVVGKEICYCWLELRLQEVKNVDQP
jgi:hypothetical protein